MPGDYSLHISNRCVQPGWDCRSTRLHHTNLLARAGTGALVRKSEFTRPCSVCRRLDIACSALEETSLQNAEHTNQGRLLALEPELLTEQREFRVQVLSSIDEVDSAQWNAAAIHSGELNPFVLHAFLKALEDSESAVANTGWVPHHLVVREGDGDDIVGCCPIYLKGHSYGEYVFDHSWAGMARQLGQRYYPKLQSCVPFTPVGGPRLMVRNMEDRAPVTAALAKAIIQMTEDYGISSAHVTFNGEEEWKRLSDMGFLQRAGIQYHWENPGYSSFDDFLSNLKQSKRKNIKQERKAVASSGLKIRRLTGNDLKPSHWNQFYEFYRNTTDMKWGSAYLTPEFFQELGATMGEHVLLVVAQEGDEDSPLVAGALNLIGSDAIYGRNWGCSYSCRVKHLHFELCYYQAQEEAIERGLKRVEAGAQGEHKLQRGYLPSKTYSSHYIHDQHLAAVLGRYLESEQTAVDYNLLKLSEIASPYKDSQGRQLGTSSTCNS